MSIAPLPTPLQHMGGRRFSFYPPVRNIEHNEWVYGRATWSECVVINTRSGAEVSVPRMFLGDISRVDEPVMVVRLNRELTWKDGAIVPREKRVIELPVARHDSLATSPRSGGPAQVISIRLEPEPEVRARKWIGVAVVLGVVACTIVADIARQAQSHQRADVFRGYRSYLQLSEADDFGSTLSKLGRPSAVRTGSSGEHVFQALVYASRRYAVILMGPSAQEARYLGTLDSRGRVLDTIQFADGSSSAVMLRSLPPL